MKKKRIYSALPLMLLAIAIYFPSMSTFFEMKFAAYKDDIYAVGLEDGSFVYGKIESSSAGWLKLSNVFYFQSIEVNDNATRNLVAQSSNALTAPDNFLWLNKSKVASMERVGENSKLVEVINQFKK